MNRHNDLILKDALQLFLRQYKYRNRLDQVRVKSLWEKLMGPSICDLTSEIRLKNRKVFIVIKSAALRQELSYSTEKIKNLLNEHLGESTVEDVVIR